MPRKKSSVDELEEKDIDEMDESPREIMIDSLYEKLEEILMLIHSFEKRLPMNPLPPVHTITENIDKVNIPEKSSANSVIRFHITGPEKVREFTEDENGENWKEIANEFHKNNIHQIREREDI